MRVLQIITSLSTGGAEKLIVDSAPLYRQMGIDVDIMSLSGHKTPFWDSLDNVAGFDIIGLTNGTVYNPFLVFKIIPYLKRYDIIHLHLFPTLYWVVIAKWLSFSKTKLVYTEHNTNNRRRQLFFFRILDKLIYRNIDTITCITQGVKKNLKEHLNSIRKMHVINNGVDTAQFEMVTPVGDLGFFEENSFKLIQVSSFRKQKDQITVIKSLIHLPDHVKLILVGDGVLVEESKMLVKELGLLSRVLFLGNRYDIPDLVNYSDVSILSSHWEGFGLAIVEGMAARKPVIASKIDGIKEIVEGYGLLFEPGNDVELASLISQLMSDSALYKRTADRCLERSKDFDIHKMIESYIEVYQYTLNNSIDEEREN